MPKPRRTLGLRNGHAIISLFSIPTSPVLQSQKLEIERLFLHFCSATVPALLYLHAVVNQNEVGLNPGARPGSYCVPIP